MGFETILKVKKKKKKRRKIAFHPNLYQQRFGLFPPILSGVFCPMPISFGLCSDGFALGASQASHTWNRAEGLAAALMM